MSEPGTTSGYTDTVMVKNVDFNGSSFDGCPFSSTPGWLHKAVTENRIRIVGQDTDYAAFDVDTPEGVARAEPGDRIKINYEGAMTVWRQGPWAKVLPR